MKSPVPLYPTPLQRRFVISIHIAWVVLLWSPPTPFPCHSTPPSPPKRIASAAESNSCRYAKGSLGIARSGTFRLDGAEDGHFFELQSSPQFSLSLFPQLIHCTSLGWLRFSCWFVCYHKLISRTILELLLSLLPPSPFKLSSFASKSLPHGVVGTVSVSYTHLRAHETA